MTSGSSASSRARLLAAVTPFGLVALQIRVVARPALVFLLVGSLLAITGIDRLAFTSEANPTIFGPLLCSA